MGGVDNATNLCYAKISIVKSNQNQYKSVVRLCQIFVQLLQLDLLNS